LFCEMQDGIPDKYMISIKYTNPECDE